MVGGVQRTLPFLGKLKSLLVPAEQWFGWGVVWLHTSCFTLGAKHSIL